ncbi:MAG: ATP-binding cassette domain-containing protein [Myxococcota bacterium]|nr:ATP-binding cassette domain-containing protein [Myxococcota bacterium]MDW8361287.1 ATP-binding cassette domain-containing protein [Myxococcales bacterium]
MRWLPGRPPPPDPDPDGPVHVAVRDLVKRYGDHEVLRGVSFDVLRGRINVIIGASGSGKTVLVRQVIRLERPDAGRIVVDGRDIAALDERALGPIRRKFGMVFQMSALFDSMTVYDNVAFPLREHTRMPERQIRERVLDRLAALGVEQAVAKLPAELSGGMRKRVAVARALVLEPQILIFDEPTTGLDPLTSRSVDELIVRTVERFGVTAVVISHDMASVFGIADHIHYLHRGRIELSGPPSVFLETDNESALAFLRASGVSPEALRRAAGRAAG